MASAPFIFRLFAPSPEDVSSVVTRLAPTDFTYPAVAATRGTLPPGWDHDETRSIVGRGAEQA